MEDKIVFATGNEGKMREIRSILSDLGLPVLSMKEAGVSPEIEENGTTFGENAEDQGQGCLGADRAASFWPTIPVWWWTIWAASPAFTPPVIWARTPPTR